MYKCKKCGAKSDRTLYERDGADAYHARCVHCESGEVAEVTANCAVCGRDLCEGEYAFEAGEMLICPDCVTEVMV